MMLESLKIRARKLKQETLALYFAYRDPRTPWFAKVLAVMVLAYAFSPIDLIPDFVPVLGYLDDLILIPIGIALALKLIPAGVMEDARRSAEQAESGKFRVGYAGAAFIAIVWAIILIVFARIIFPPLLNLWH
jgi:uncharacterized membrane protein YkvA (DUF1232 family)